MSLRVVSAVLASLCLFATSARAEVAADHYFWRPVSEDTVARPWAVLLPGSSGMSILGDDEHYFRAAAWLNQRGVDALIIDYHGAARFVPGAEDGSPGDRMTAIVADALTIERAAGRARSECPGVVIGWSLGAEGAWTLAALTDSGFRAAAMYYPTVRRPQPYANALPVLVLQGTADNVTPESDLRAFVAARRAESAALDVVTFAGASHGFDVTSLDPARTMRFPPLIGQRVTFGYNAEAAASASSTLENFLRREGVVGGMCDSR